MKCPSCGSLQTKVIDSHETYDGLRRNRKRRCLDCDSVFYTKEIYYTPNKGESNENELMTVLDGNAYKPERAYPTDAGLDLRSPVSVVVPARGNVVIDTGVAVAIPDGYVGLITSKSGMMLKGITSRGTIDSSYRGTIKAVLYNSSGYDYTIQRGDKVTQLVILPIVTPKVVIVDGLSKTDRGAGSFGSTGK